MMKRMAMNKHGVIHLLSHLDLVQGISTLFHVESKLTISAPGNINTAPSRFATLGDVNRDDDDEDEGRQNYFAGGEKSYLTLPHLRLYTD
jgi:hypothetical protein